MGTPVRVPLVTAMDNRGSTANTDAKVVNGYVEKRPTEQYSVIKRPGYALNATYSVAAGTAYGIVNWLGDIYSIVGGTLYKNGSSVGTVDTTGGAYFFSSTQATGGIIVSILILTNRTHMYSYDPVNGLQAAGSVSAPPYPLVGGVAYLDGITYCLTAGGGIHGSEIYGITNFDPLNIIVASIEPDPAVMISKHLLYLIIFKGWSTEVFEDVGQIVGSALGPVESAKMNYGCLNARSVIDVDGDIFWVGSTRNGSAQIFHMNSLALDIISTPNVERLIEGSNFSTVYAWSYKGGGHSFYIVTFVDINLTLAYDIREHYWSPWTDTNGNYLPIFMSTYVGTSVLLQHVSNGKVYTMSPSQVTDAGNPITFDLVTPNFDAGKDKRKYVNLTHVKGDAAQGNILYIRNNDFDYDSASWTNFRTIDMNKKRPVITSGGSFYRRAYHFRHTASTALRIDDLDLDIALGVL